MSGNPSQKDKNENSARQYEIGSRSEQSYYVSLTSVSYSNFCDKS
jgi:hypothetical protein